ncbi:MAG: PAS domain-containing protein, partial [Proteobacteria bacterium]|nr:PAS domain-containing protein [Pseudomonadota bacterium]
MSDLKQIEIHQLEFIDAMESLKDMVVILDKDYICQAANRSFLNNYNIDRQMLIGQSISPILGKEFFNTILKSKIDSCFKGETVFYEMTIENEEGEKRYLQLLFSPVTTNDSINRSMVTISDETEKHKLSQEKTNLIKELQA